MDGWMVCGTAETLYIVGQDNKIKECRRSPVHMSILMLVLLLSILVLMPSC